MSWMGLWWIFIPLVVIVIAVWYAVSTTKQAGLQKESPEDVLKRRYANGEIDRDTYERMLADLRR